MEEANSPHNLIMIRHGESTFNRTYLDFLSDHNIDPAKTTWEDSHSLPGFMETVAYVEQNIDAPLTPHGIEQCKATRQLLQDEQVDLVLVSPYQRALQTCNQIFGGRDIKIQVHPLLSEVFRYVCDIGHDLQQKKVNFAEYDFSHMADTDELWFIDHLQPHHHDQYRRHVDEKSSTEATGSFEDKQKHLLTLMKEKMIYETPAQLRTRVAKVKDLLLTLSKTYKKIAIVSHYYIVRTLLSESYSENGESNLLVIKNAHPYHDSIERLHQFK